MESERGPGGMTFQLPARPEFGHELRALLRDWLEDIGARKSDAFEVVLAAMEAFTNAVEHPHRPTSHLVDVKASLTDGCATISIHDYGTWQGDPTRKEQGGLGLVIIKTVMDHVHVDADANGTTVTMKRHLATPLGFHRLL